MKIAAVITAYNSAETIERALDSVLQQTRPADEIIVVDDGSADNTCEIVLRRYRQVRLVQRLNGGPAAARNSGLFATDADWIAMLDGDDQWLPEKLAIVEVAARQHPEASVLFSSVLAVEDGAIDERIGCPEWVLGVEELLRGCPILTPSSAVVRTSAVRAIGGFNETQRDGEDWEFWLRMAGQGPLRRVAGPLAVYYIHAGGHHNRYVQTRKQATRFVLREGLRHIRKNGLGATAALWGALGEHFKAFTYYASLQRNVGLTLSTGVAATVTDPVRGSYAAGRSLFRAVTGF
jgi:glycosyltransferase involved in cell wall biosynthesis